MTDPFAGMPKRRRAAPPGAYEHVVGAGAGLRRRQFLQLACVPLVVALLGGVVVGTRGGGDRGAQRITVTDPTASPSATRSGPAPTPSESASPSAVPSPSPSPPPSGTASRRPGRPSGPPSPSDDPDSYWAATHDDGVPGWAGPYGGCSQSAEQPRRGEAPAAGLQVSFEPGATAFRPGVDVYGHLVVANPTRRTAEFTTEGGWNGMLLDAAGRVVTGRITSDAIPVHGWTIPAGEKRRLRVRFESTRCGDGSDDPRPAVAPGRYRALAGIGDWYAEPVAVDLVAGAPATITWHEDRPLPVEPGEECTYDLGAATPIGAPIRFEPDSTSVGSGDTLTGTIVVTGDDSYRYFRLARAYSPVAFRDGSGVTPPRRETDRDPTSEIGLRPDEVYRFRVSIPARRCPGPGGAVQPLPPGEYDVVAGLGVLGGDGDPSGWFAPPVRVTVTA